MHTSLRSVPPVFVVLVTITLGGAAVAACTATARSDRCLARGAALPRARRTPARNPHLISLAHARAGEVAAALQGVGQGRPRGGRTLYLTGPVRVTAYHHGNALLVVANAQDLVTLRHLVKQLDQPRRRVRLQVSLLEGRLGPETAGDVPLDRGGRPTGRLRLTGHRVLDTASLLLAEREERALPLSAEARGQLGCLWGGGPPRIAVSTRLGAGGRVELSLRRFPAAATPGPQLSRPSASVVLSVARRRTAAVAFVPAGQASGLGPSFRLADPDAQGFVVPSRCGGPRAHTRVLVITPTLVDG